MARFRFPDSSTSGRHPSTWPTAAELSNTALVQQLQAMQHADLLERQGRGQLQYAGKQEDPRLVFNALIAELLEEAITRRLVDPYAEGGVNYL